MDDEQALLAEATNTSSSLVSEEQMNSTFMTGELWREFHVLDRIMYKFHNQQRRDIHFQRLQVLRRRLQRLSGLQRWLTWGLCDRNEGNLGKCRAMLDLAHRVAQQARQDCMHSYEALHAVLQLVIYVPFVLIGMGAVARIFTALDRLLAILRAYRLDMHSAPGVAATRTPRVRERTESGWEVATGTTKRRKFNKKAGGGRGPAGQDEIDDIFRLA